MNQIKEDSQASQSLVAKPGEGKKIKHVLNCLTPTQRKFAMPAAQDKIVYLHFIYNCIVKSVAYVFLYCLITYFSYVNESTGSWHGDLRRYKHKNLLVIFLFTSCHFTDIANLLLRIICK